MSFALFAGGRKVQPPISFRSQTGQTGSRGINVGNNGGQAGDVCILIGAANIWVPNNQAPAPNPGSNSPSGWAKIGGTSVSTEGHIETGEAVQRMNLVGFHRRLTGSEGNVNLFNSGWDEYCIRMILYKDSSAAINQRAAATGGSGGSSTLSLNSVTGQVIVIGAFAAGRGIGVSSVTFSNGNDGSHSNSTTRLELQVRRRLDANGQNTNIAHGSDSARRYLGMGLTAS